MNFKISVIIPVFNAEKFIAKAIYSALKEKEVGEVIVVNDGSTDRTGIILKKLLAENSKIFHLEHGGGNNKGRSASRNLGIRRAKFDFIAFLDADDYYLKDRFKGDRIIFERNQEVDGVYNAIGVHFYRKPANSEERERIRLTTIKYPVSSEDLFYHQWISGSAGHFSGNGLTVKRSIFEKVGYFDENLEVAEDTHLWMRISLCCKLVWGDLNNPVAMRGVHNNNIFTEINQPIYQKNYLIMYASLLCWGIRNDIDKNILLFFGKKIKEYMLINVYQEGNGFYKNAMVKLWFKIAVKYPLLLTDINFLRLSPFKIFGFFKGAIMKMKNLKIKG